MRLNYVATGDFSDLQREMKKLQSLAKEIKPNTSAAKNLGVLIKDLEKVAKLAGTEFFDVKDAKQFTSALEDMSKSASKYINTIEKGKASDLIDNKDIKNINDFANAIKNAQSKVERNLTNMQGRMAKALDVVNNKLAGAGYRPINASDTVDALLGDPNKVESIINNRMGQWDRAIQKRMKKKDGRFEYDRGRLLNDSNYQDSVVKLFNGKEQTQVQTMISALKEMDKVTKDINNSFLPLKNLNVPEFLKGDIKVDNLEQAARSMETLGDKTKEVERGLSKKLNTDGLKGISESTNKIENNLKGAVSEVENFNRSLDNIEQGVVQFFALENSIRLFKRAAREAFQTVKDLDASLTEIAVVSDYDLDDLWGQRLHFSDEATRLGVSTLDLVDATKLYIQQGLSMADAQKVATETVKMARIANLDGAEATDLMTASIRGFNMELTEATRINDVYSKLAAITAADTREIAVAMSKTASIAHNAGASFENTSAFLSQIIEVTREAPETAGTALKTVIARFNELKKPISEIGEVDGEVVDANRIETALRQAGIALRDTKGEFRDFDEVILELSERWDTLDVMTQRYIATQAAGSRQQSRFIALLSNNKRLLELTNAATNAAGAGQEQFNKTLESLESKLNKLTNQLKIFYTGLLNQRIIKGAIDSLTTILNLFNKLTESLTNSKLPLANLAGSLANLSLLGSAFVFGGRAVKGIVNSFFSAIKQEAQSSSSKAQGRAIGQKLVEPIQAGVAEGMSKGTGGSKGRLGKLTGIGEKGTLANIQKGSLAVLGFATAVDAVARATGNANPTLEKFTNTLSNAASGAMLGAQLGGVKGAVIGGVIGSIGTLISLVVELGDKAGRTVEKLKTQSNNAEQAINGINEQVTILEKFAHSDSVSNRFAELTYNSKEWRTELETVNEELAKIKERFPDIETKWNNLLGVEIPDYEAVQKEIEKLQKGKDFLSRGQAATAEGSAYALEGAGNDKQLATLRLQKQQLSQNTGNVNTVLQDGETRADGIERLNAEIVELEKNIAAIDVTKLLPGTLEKDLANSFSNLLVDGVSNSNAFRNFSTNLYNNLEEELRKPSPESEQVKALLAKNGIELVRESENSVKEWQGYMRQLGLEVTDDIDEMKSQFAVAIRGMFADDLTNTIVDIANNLNIQKLVSEALVDGDAKDLEKQLLSALGLEENEENLKRVGELAEGIITTTQHDLEEMHKSLQELGLADAFEKEFSQLLPTTQKMIGDIIIGFQKLSPELGEVITNTLGKELKGKTEQEILSVLDAFKGFENIDSEETLKIFKTRLEDAGVAAPNEILKALRDKLYEVGSASEDWSKKISAVNDLLNKANSGDRDGYTEEQKQEAINSGAADERDFYKDASGNYYYAGSDPKAMGQRVFNYQQGVHAQMYGAAADRYNAYQTATNDGIAQRWNNIQSPTSVDSQSYARQYLNMGFKPSQVGATMGQLNDGTFDAEQLKQKVSALTQEVLNGGLDKAKQDIDNLRQQGATMMVDKSPEDIMKSQKSAEETQNLDALKIATSKLTATTKEAVEARQQFNKAYEEGDYAQAAAAARDLMTAEIQERIAASADKVVPRVRDLVEEYYELADAPVRDDAAMVENAKQLSAAFTELTGLEVGDEFFQITGNIDLFNEAIRGSDEALDQLIEMAWEGKESAYLMAQQFGISADDILDAIAGLDGQTFGIDGTLDATDIFNKLVAIVGDTEKAAKLLEAFANIKVKPITKMNHFYHEAPVFNKETGELVGYKGYRTEVPYTEYVVEGIPNTKINLSGGNKTGAPSGGGGSGNRMNNARTASGGGGGGGRGKKSGGGGGSKKKPKTGSGSSKKGSEKETEPWIQAYDWLYNLVNKTNEAIRVKTKLEREYTKVLQQEGTHLGDTLLNRDKIRDNLKEQLELQKQLRDGRMTETNKLMKDNSDLQKYARYDAKLGYVTIDWDAIDKVSGNKGNNDLGKRIDDYIKELERLSGQLNDANDSLDNISDQLHELQQRGREEMTSLESRVVDALDRLFAKEIEKLDKLNQTISNSDQRILSGLQEGINEFRQLREQDKAAKNISDQERRLALLKMDTSGANEMEIRALEKSIEEAREAHLDSLVDRNIEQMAKDAQLAQEQRQLQIDLMSMQLEQARENGTIAQLANQTLTNAMFTSQQEIQNAMREGQEKLFQITGNVPTTLNQLLADSALFKGMGTQTQKDWKEALDKSISTGFEFWIDNNRLDGKGSNSARMRKSMSGKTIEFTDRTGKKRKGVVQSDGRVRVGNYDYAGVTQGTDGSYYQSADAYAHSVMKKTSVSASKSSSSANKSSSSGSKSSASDLDYRKVAATIWRNATPYQGGWGEGKTRVNRLTEVFGATGAKKIQQYINSYVSRRTPNLMDNKLYPHRELVNKYSYTPARSKFKKYKTGGLVDYTGMAWVDGTAQKPELMLNAKDTVNFIELTKALRQNSTPNKGQQPQNVYFNIKADIANDYDVDRLYKRLKDKMSNESARGTINKVGF